MLENDSPRSFTYHNNREERAVFSVLGTASNIILPLCVLNGLGYVECSGLSPVLVQLL